MLFVLVSVNCFMSNNCGLSYKKSVVYIIATRNSNVEPNQNLVVNLFMYCIIIQVLIQL